VSDALEDSVQAQPTEVVRHPAASDCGWVDAQQLRERRAELCAREPIGLEDEQQQDGK
jgi:hypothetical protein